MVTWKLDLTEICGSLSSVQRKWQYFGGVQ